jgi:hypothetical protein
MKELSLRYQDMEEEDDEESEDEYQGSSEKENDDGDDDDEELEDEDEDDDDEDGGGDKQAGPSSSFLLSGLQRGSGLSDTDRSVQIDVFQCGFFVTNKTHHRKLIGDLVQAMHTNNKKMDKIEKRLDDLGQSVEGIIAPGTRVKLLFSMELIVCSSRKESNKHCRRRQRPRSRPVWSRCSLATSLTPT